MLVSWYFTASNENDTGKAVVEAWRIGCDLSLSKIYQQLKGACKIYGIQSKSLSKSLFQFMLYFNWWVNSSTQNGLEVSNSSDCFWQGFWLDSIGLRDLNGQVTVPTRSIWSCHVDFNTPFHFFAAPICFGANAKAPKGWILCCFELQQIPEMSLLRLCARLQ